MDDAAQEVFIVAARRIDDIENGRERSFLLGTALRIAAARRRKAARSPVANDYESLADPNPNPEHLTERLQQARQVLDSVMNEMSEQQRTVFVLFELEELPAPQIAEILSVPIGTVASRLRRAREIFQRGVRRFRAQTRGEAG